MPNMGTKLLLANVEDALPTFAAASFDACYCDPPYGIRFLGERWDYDVPSVDVWREVLRVLKPSAPLLAFGGRRTAHRLAVAIEDAGFFIDDQLAWFYGQGKPATKQKLKPGHEPLVLAYKPPVEGARLGIESCRTPEGRWPSTVALDEEAAAALDEQSGILRSHGGGTSKGMGLGSTSTGIRSIPKGDSGGASRFFYCAKVRGRDNPHPTRKPEGLATYHARLLRSETSRRILVPYAGSGSEMLGAIAAGWETVVGIENRPDYVEIARRRLPHAA